MELMYGNEMGIWENIMGMVICSYEQAEVMLTWKYGYWNFGMSICNWILDLL